MSPAKTPEPIKLPFGLRTLLALGNHVLDGVQIPMGRDIAMATNFYLSMGYNFGCMIANDTLFDCRG